MAGNDVVIDVKTKGTKKAKSAFGDLTKGAAKLGLAFGAIKVVQFGLDAVGAFSELEESVNAVSVVYGEQADVIARLGENSAEAFGITTTEVNKAAVQMAAFAEKIDEADPADAFTNIIQRATDFASVMDIETSEALDKFQSGLAGQSRPLKEFGLDISAAAVEQVALAAGIIETGETMTEAEKVQARYLTIMQQTEKMAGDFANTADDLANSQKTLTAKWKEAQTQLGEKLAPMMLKLGDIMTDLIPVFGLVVDVFGAFLDKLGPGLDIIAGVARALGDLTEASQDSAESGGFMDGVWSNIADTAFDLIPDIKLAKDAIDGISLAMEGSDAIGVPFVSTLELMAAREKRVAEEADFMAGRLPVASEAVDELGDELKEVSTKGLEALSALVKVKESVQELADPVFRAEQATRELDRVLEEIQEDFVVTSEEADRLSEAYGAQQTAADAVTPENIEAYSRQGRNELRLLDEGVEVSKDVLETLPASALSGFDGTARAFQRLIDNPVKVEIVATLPTSGAFDRALAGAISRARRSGGGIDGINF